MRYARLALQEQVLTCGEDDLPLCLDHCGLSILHELDARGDDLSTGRVQKDLRDMCSGKEGHVLPSDVGKIISLRGTSARNFYEEVYLKQEYRSGITAGSGTRVYTECTGICPSVAPRPLVEMCKAHTREVECEVTYRVDIVWYSRGYACLCKRDVQVIAPIGECLMDRTCEVAVNSQI